MEELLGGDATKIRKRGGCSPSSSASSMLQNYRFKRAILAGKKNLISGKGVSGGSSTPVPTWRMDVILKAASPTLSTRSKPGHPPVSARKLAATLWELNDVPSPRVVEDDVGLIEKRIGRKGKMSREVNGNSGFLPPHLSDPSHSPLSERMERSGTGSHRRRESSISRKLKTDHFDTLSNASFMEIETRSRCQTPSGSTVGSKSRLKDVSNTLTTSKELLKIISRMWGQDNQPSSSMSLISALHSELERARLQINQLIHSDNKDIGDLLKRFAEEKTAWKLKEQEVVEAAIESTARELEVERKLRRQFESLNKKLGKELAEIKASFLKAVKELESEKKARGVMEQVCHELVENIGEDKEVKRETSRMQEEIEKRVQTKISDAKQQFEEKNASADNRRSDLEAFLESNNRRENGHKSTYHRRDGDLSFCRGEARESDAGEVEDTTDSENSGESDLHSIELNYDLAPRNSKRLLLDEEIKGRKFNSNQVARSSTSLLRSVSSVLEWGNVSNHEIEKQVARRSCGDEVQLYKAGKGVRDSTLSSSRLGVEREIDSPSSQRGPPWPSREPCSVALQRHITMEGVGIRGRRDEDRGEGHNSRRSRR
ncbi:hypothetical protein KSS87_001634 [Heliosperma pusillum]|nr:hypothetical protein KSS87_001634 [Heliosperma pusillum]